MLILKVVVICVLHLGCQTAGDQSDRDHRWVDGVHTKIVSVVCTRLDPTGRGFRVRRPLCGLHGWYAWTEQQNCTIEERV